MKSTASTSILGQNQQLGSSSSHRKIQSLEDQVTYLNKIVEVKDHTLALLDKLFKQSLSITKDNIMTFQNINSIATSLSNSYFHVEKTAQKMVEICKGLNEISFNFVTYYQNEESRIMKQHNEYMKILRNIGWSEYKSEKDFCLNFQHRQKNNSTTQTYIYQIPIEMIRQIESQDTAVQLDPLQTDNTLQQNYNGNEFLVSQDPNPINLQLVQIPVQINHTHQIEVHMIRVQEIPTEMFQIREVPIQLRVIHQIPVEVRRQFEIPIELQIVEQQIAQMNGRQNGQQDQMINYDCYNHDFIDNFAEFDDMRHQIQKLALQNELLLKENEDLKQKIIYLESKKFLQIEVGDIVYDTVQTDQNQMKIQIPVEITIGNQTDHEFSINLDPSTQNSKEKILDQIRTKEDLQIHSTDKIQKQDNQIVSLTYMGNPSPEIRGQAQREVQQCGAENQSLNNNIILIEQLQQRDLDESEQKQFDQFYAENQEQGENQVQLFENNQVQLFEERQQAIHNIIRQIAIELIIEKQIVKQILVQKQKEVIKEVQKQIIKQIVVEKEIIKEVPVYVIKEVPVEVEIRVQKEVPVIQYIQKIVEVQKIVQKIFQVPVVIQIPVQIIKHVSVEVIKQVKVVQYQQILKQVPVQVIIKVPNIRQIPVVVQIQKIVEVPVEKFVEKLVQKVVEVPIIKEVPVEMIIEVQKVVEKLVQKVVYEPKQNVVFIQIPVIKEVPVVLQVEKIVQVPVEVIVQNQKIIEKQKQIQKIIEKQVQKIVIKEVQKIIYQTLQKPVYIQIPVIKQVPVQIFTQIVVIKQIPVQIFTQIQKKVFVMVPYIEEIPVQLIHEIPVKFTIQSQKQTKQQVPIDLFELNKQNPVNHRSQQLVVHGYQDQKQIILNHQNLQQQQITLNQQNQQQENNQVVIYIYQIPVEIVQEKIVDRIVEVQKIVKIKNTEQIEDKEIVQVQKNKFIPIVVQIPVQLNTADSNIKVQNSIVQGLVDLEQQNANYVQNNHELQQQQEEEKDRIQMQIDSFYNDVIVEIPIQCFIQVEKKELEICEVPVFCQIQKLVEVQKIIQVERLVEIEKVVQVQKIIQVERIVQVEKIIEVQKIIEVVVEKIIEVEKVVEVEKIIQVQKIIQIEKIIEVEKEVEVEKIIQVEKAVQVQKIIEVEKEIEVEKIVEVFKPIQVERIVQVQKIVKVQKIVELLREVEVEKILEVPIYKEVEKIVKVFVQKIVEVPVQVIVEVFKEVPVIMEVPIELFQQQIQPTIIQNQNIKSQHPPIILQIPVELQIEVQARQELPTQVIEKEVIKEVIKQVQKIVQVEKIVQVQKMAQIIQFQKIVQVQKIVYVDRPVLEIVQVQKIVEVIVQKFVEKIVEIPEQKKHYNQQDGHQIKLEEVQKTEVIMEHPVALNQQNVQIKISSPHKVQNLKQIQISLPQQEFEKSLAVKQFVSHQVQTEEGFIIEMDLMSNIDKIQFNRNQSNSEGSMLKVWEIPVELQLDYNIEQIQRNIENKYKQKIVQLNTKFNTQIDQLQLNLGNTQKQIAELNTQNVKLKQNVQAKAQTEQSLKEKLDELQKNKEDILQSIQKLNQQTSRKSEIIQKQKQENEEIQQKLQKIQTFMNNPVFQQLPIEIKLSTQNQDCEVQTDDIELFQNIEVIEIPDHFNQVENLNKEFQANKEQEQQSKLESVGRNMVEVLRPQTIQTAIQTKLFSNKDSSQRFNKVDFSSISQSQPQNSSKNYREMDIIRVYDELLGSYKFKIDEGSNCQKNIVPENQQTTGYQYMLENNVQIYEVPLEVITEPIIYEIPIFLEQFKQTSEIQTQTDYTLVHSQAEVVEQPVGIIVNKEDSDYSYYSVYNRQKIVKERRINAKSQKVALTDSDSNIVGRDESMSSKKKEILINDKHYSEYFNSRMIEIPVQLELSKENNIVQKFAIVKAFQSIFINDKKQQIEHFQEDRQMKMPSGIQVNLHSMHYDTSFHGYDPNNTLFNDSFQKLRTPSQIANLIYKNSPPKTSKPAQSVSLETDQLNQKVKQYPHAYPEANKKYAGFEIQQSSFQNITITREMVIEEQSDDNNSVEYNRMRSPNLQITEFNYQDHASAKEMLLELQQQRNRLLQMYEGMVSKYNKLKNDKDKVDEELERFKVEILDSELPSLKKEIVQNKDYINKLKTENEEKISNQKAKLEDFKETNAKLEDRIKNLIQGQQKLRQDSEKIEKNLNNFITNLEDKLYTVREDYKALKIQFLDEIDDFKIKEKELEHELRDKQDEIRRLEDQLQTKEHKLEQLIQSHQELRKNIVSLKKDQEIDPAQIYQQEFERVKEYFQEQKQMLSAQVQNLTYQLDMMRAQNKEQKDQIAHLTKQIKQLQQQIEEAQHENSKLHHIKSQIEYNYIIGVKQLQQIKNQMKEKNQILQKYQNAEQSEVVVNAGNFTTNVRQQAQFRIEYLSRRNSRIQGIQDNANYIRNLQNLIVKYERMLIEDQQQIQEYQEKVCEYLRDALEKQQEAEGLFGRLQDYQGMVNSILVEKITLEVQNKRLARAMQMSQRKIQALTKKLIEALRMRYDQDQQQPRYYYYR